MRPCLKIFTFFIVLFFTFSILVTIKLFSSNYSNCISSNLQLLATWYLSDEKICSGGQNWKTKLLNILLGIQHESEIRTLFPDTSADSTDSVCHCNYIAFAWVCQINCCQNESVKQYAYLANQNQSHINPWKIPTRRPYWKLTWPLVDRLLAQLDAKYS